MDEAMKWYKASSDSQDEWPQFHHICYWELVWTCQYSRDWKQALFYSDKLYQVWDKLILQMWVLKCFQILQKCINWGLVFKWLKAVEIVKLLCNLNTSPKNIWYSHAISNI